MSMHVYTCVCVHINVHMYNIYIGEGNGNPLQYSCLEAPLKKFFFKFLKIIVSIYFWPRWALVADGLSLVVVNRGFSSLCWLLLSQSKALGVWASGVTARRLSNCGLWALEHRLSYSKSRGIFPDQRSNPCLLHRQTDSLPLSHQGSPGWVLLLPCSYNQGY